MRKQEMARMKALYGRGGDNPYAVEYDDKNREQIESVDNEGHTMQDSYASKGKDGDSFVDKYDEKNKKEEKQGFLAKAKSYSF